MLPPNFTFWRVYQRLRSQFSRPLQSTRARHGERRTQLNQKGFEAVESSTRLQSLLAQHRQIVESAPAEVDRSRLEANQREYIAKSAELSALLNELIHRKMDQETEKTQAQIAAELPDLETAAQQVMFYAYNFAQDKALESAAAYAKIADDLEGRIRHYRLPQIRAADDAVSSLSKVHGHSLFGYRQALSLRFC